MTTFTDQESYDAYTKAFGRKPHSGFRVLLRDPSRPTTSELPAGGLKGYLSRGFRWVGEDGFSCSCGREFKKYPAIQRHQMKTRHD